jgi:hypothetical protein
MKKWYKPQGRFIGLMDDDAIYGKDEDIKKMFDIPREYTIKDYKPLQIRWQDKFISAYDNP